MAGNPYWLGLPGVPRPTVEDGIPSLSQVIRDMNNQPVTLEQIVSGISTTDLINEVKRRQGEPFRESEWITSGKVGDGSDPAVFGG